jgi:uncharacterized protein
VSSIDKEGRTPLHYAALANDADALSKLLTAGADPNVADRVGFTPLHFAAQEGAITSAQILLAAGAQVDAANSYGNTPLFSAVFNSRGRGELIHLLRRHGANPLHLNNARQTPAGVARLIANYDVAQFVTDLTATDKKT